MTWYENGALDDVPILRKVGSLYDESKCRYVWADVILLSEAHFVHASVPVPAFLLPILQCAFLSYFADRR